MFITKQRAIRPNSLVIDGCSVGVVDEFKLLGITIDHNLFFNKKADQAWRFFLRCVVSTTNSTHFYQMRCFALFFSTQTNH